MMGKICLIGVQLFLLSFVFLLTSAFSVSAQTTTCTNWMSTVSSLPSCSNPLFQPNCQGSGGSTGTECCTGTSIAGGPYQYCENQVLGQTPQYSFRCCNTTVCTPGDQKFTCTGSCRKPDGTSCPASEGALEIATCNADGSGWNSSYSCSVNCTTCPPPPPPPAPTCDSNNCGLCNSCSSCIAQTSCGWTGSSCQAGNASCPAGATQWYWSSCSVNVCTPPPPPPPPGTACRATCSYSQPCTTSSGQSGTQSCSGVTGSNSSNSTGACGFDTSGVCSPNCSSCVVDNPPICSSFNLSSTSGAPGNQVTINTTISDNDATKVSTIQLFRDSSVIGTYNNSLNQEPYQISQVWDTTNVPAGTYNIIANANDGINPSMFGLNNNCHQSYTVLQWFPPICTSGVFSGCKTTGGDCTDWGTPQDPRCADACSRSNRNSYCSRPTVTCSSSPNPADSGTTVTWTATPAGGSGTYTSYAWSGDASGSNSTTTATYTNTTTTNVTKTATVTVTDSAGNTSTNTDNSCTVTVNPAPAPAVSLTANPASIANNASSTLSWTTTDCTSANSCSCNASSSWSGAKSISGGSQSTGNLTGPDNYTYTLTCTNSNGTSLPSTANVSVGGATCTSETDSAFCSRLGKNCGSVTGTDNCGNSRNVTSCGTCSGSQTCGGGGTPNVCGGGSCAPETDSAFCSRLGKNCGSVIAPDNCGTNRTVACGTCSGSQTCNANVCTGGTPSTTCAWIQTTGGDVHSNSGIKMCQ